MSVLCGTDFSRGAREAVRVAAQLAGRSQQPLHLVHGVDSALWDEDLGRRAKAAAARRLNAEADDARGLGAPSIEHAVTEGAAYEAILDEAAKRKPGLIVIGAVGRAAESAPPIGGTAERIAARSTVPVLVVRGEGALEAWLRGERRLKVVVGDDLTFASEPALRWAASLRSIGPCEYVVAHVYSLLAEKSRLGVGGPLEARLSQLDEASVNALRRHAGPCFADEAVRYRVEGTLGRAAEPLLALAREESADLVVVGTAHRRGLARAWHGWASQIVLSDARCSVACVPAERRDIVEPAIVPPIRHVLAPTDFSAIANRAVAYAYALVEDRGVVHLLHVEDLGWPAPPPQPGKEKLSPHDQLRGLVPETGERRVETRFTVVSDEDVSGAITAVAERLDVDAVCMGTHGRSGVANVLLGSVAQEVTDRCRRPLLLVPPLRVG